MRDQMLFVSQLMGWYHHAYGGTTHSIIFLHTYTQSLGERYGHCLNRTDYTICEDADTISAIFERLRGGGDYWAVEPVGGLAISGVRDLTTGFDSR